MSKKEKDLLKIDHPFAIFVQPADDVPGEWIAHIVGHELDNITQGTGPEHAVFMAYDLLKLLTGYCCEEHPEHDLSVATTITTSERLSGIVINSDRPAYGCSRCDYKVLVSHTEDDSVLMPTDASESTSTDVSEPVSVDTSEPGG